MYNAQGKIKPVNMIEQYRPLVKLQAVLVKNQLPDHVDLEDLIQAGMIGLIDAVEKYQPSTGVAFEHYAKPRIRGAIFDDVRSNDPIARHVRDVGKKIERARQTLQIRLGRAPDARELAEQAGIPMEEYQQAVSHLNAGNLISLDEIGVDQLDVETSNHTQSPLEDLVQDRNRQLVMDAVGKLSKREQEVVTLYYVEELSFRDIGLVMKVSESRICQIHGQIMRQLRDSIPH